MSLCLLVQTPDTIIMSGDSRESIEIDGMKYATGNQMRKIQRIGSQVIFTTGSAHVAKSIIEEYKDSVNWTIENLHTIMIKHVNRFIQEHGHDYFGERKNIVGLVIGAFQDGKSAFYAMSSDRSEVMECIGENLRASDGARCTEALALLKQCGHNDIRESYQQVYNKLSCEDIGGELTMFAIDKSGIKEVSFPIVDSRQINTLPSSKAMYSREHGMIIEREDHSSKVTMNSDEMKWEVDGVKRLHYDAIADKLMFGGTLEAADGIFSGNLSAVGGTFTGALQGGTIAIGSGNNIFKADSSGAYLGHATFASAPFRVNMSGHMIAVGGEFSGTISAAIITGGQINGTNINGATITGGVFKTATSGSRVEITNGQLFIYDTSGLLNMLIDATTLPPRINFYDAGVLKTSVYRSFGNFLIATDDHNVFTGFSSTSLGTGSAPTYINGSARINGGTPVNSITQSGTASATLPQLEAQVNTIIQNLRAMKIYAT